MYAVKLIISKMIGFSALSYDIIANVLHISYTTIRSFSIRRRVSPQQIEIGHDRYVREEHYPFGFQVELTWKRFIQIALGTVILAPIRIIVLSLTLPVSLILANILTRFSTEKEMQELMQKRWQKFCVHSLALVGKFQLFFCSVVVTQKGIPAPREEAPILVLAPHSTLVDGFFMFCHGIHSTLPAPVSRVESTHLLVVGTLLRATNPILVHRFNSSSKKDSVEAIKERARSPSKFPQTMVFPEGTNSNRKSLLTFKPGAFFPGVPVQPVILRFNMWDTITWTFDGTNGAALMFLTLCQTYISMTIEYLPVYKPDEDEKKHAMKFANNVREIMATALNIPVSDLAYENGFLFELCKKLKIPTKEADFNFHALMKATNHGIKQMCKRMYEYAELNCEDRDGITKESLMKHLFIPNSKIGTQFAESLNLNETSKINFCQYVRLFSKYVDCVDGEMKNHSFENIFQCLNLSCKPYLGQNDFHRVFNEIFTDVPDEDRNKCRDQCWETLISNPKHDYVEKEDFIQVLERTPIYIHLFNLITINPPEIIKQRLKNIIQ